MNPLIYTLLLASPVVWVGSGAATSYRTSEEPAEVDVKGISNWLHGGHPIDDWKEKHYKVYSLHGDSLKPEETLELLKELRDLYADRSDQATVGRSTRVAKLIEASRVAEDKCNQDTLLRLNNLLEYNNIYRVNLVPYLQHFLEKQFSLCNSLLDSKLKVALASVPKEALDDVQALAGKLFKQSDGTDVGTVTPEAVAQASLDFIEDSEGPFDTKLMGSTLKLARFHLKPKFNLLIVESCSKVVESLDEVAKVYEQLMRDLETAKRLDGFALNWIRAVRMCRLINGDPDGARLEAAQMLFERCHRLTEKGKIHPVSV